MTEAVADLGRDARVAPAPLLEVQRLRKTFSAQASLLSRRRSDAIAAVDDVSFDVLQGQTFGLVGESGSGKSTVARCLVRLVEPDAGRVTFDGVDVRSVSRDALRQLRRKMQIVFQDPASSLDPRMSVGAIVEEPLIIHGLDDRLERRRRVLEILDLVGLTEEHAGRRPHEFSGGQQQRIAVARALVLRPELVILDEPVSALDVSVQAQVLNLLRDLQSELKLTYIFIVHDLAVAEYFCDEIAVMYRGAVMERSDDRSLFRDPLHPYTQALIAAAPIPDPSAAKSEDIVLPDDVVEVSVRQGCRFRPRCFIGRDRELCAANEPPLAERRPGHLAACHFPGEGRR
jgi:oligopeptide/dipeptide ABC transporter ATP-binding protein